MVPHAALLGMQRSKAITHQSLYSFLEGFLAVTGAATTLARWADVTVMLRRLAAAKSVAAQKGGLSEQ